MAKSPKKQASETAENNSPEGSQKKSFKSTKKKSFPIVALGGSAGSYDALEKFFTHVPEKTGIAYVVVVHLDPTAKGMLPELLQRATKIPVAEITDGLEMKPDHIYIIPPNKDLSVHGGKLLLLEPSKPRGLRMPIDYFFENLAGDMGQRVVGIVLSGMGADGELGLKMIKENMGMTMVQDPDTADYDSMPRSSIQTGMVDYILPPEDMPDTLINYLSHPVIVHDGRENIKVASSHNALQKIFMLLRSHTGHDFSLYKQSTIIRRVERRIAFHQLDNIVEYVHFLRENPDEIDLLFKELLIGVTKFFRDAAAFDIVKQELFTILKKKHKGESIRVWIAGCSTGEEAYSVAMMLLEIVDMLPNKHSLNVQMFASDLDQDAIEQARVGQYLGNITGDVSPERLERFFNKKENNQYQIKKEVREMIVFAQHNIIKDAPFTKLDLLCCRNLLIYLTGELQKKIMPVFHYSLLSTGLLFLGPSESVSSYLELFTPIESKWKIFRRKETENTYTRMVDFPFAVSRQDGKLQSKETAPAPRKGNSLAENFQKILLENYTPPSIIINDKGDILYINGRMGKYMELSTGQAVMNIHRIIHEDLKYELGNAIHKAVTQRKRVVGEDIKVKLTQHTHYVKITVCYMEEPQALQGLVLVAFEDKGIVPAQKKARKGVVRTEADIHVAALEKELNYTRNQLQSTIEQMETSLEELKSTNEELQSTNEELQSTNEESITTKEEMQSLNEELMTLNVMYQNKAEELTEINNDMRNLMDSTQIATIFLTNDFHILRFTPAASHIFSLLQTDIGRPITDIVNKLQYDALDEDLREVLERLIPKDLQVRTSEGKWFQLRIMPYRTLNNFINGLVLTFVDVTQMKTLEENLNQVQRYTETMLETVQENLVVLDNSLKIIATSRYFLKNHHQNLETARGRTFFELAGGRWDIPELRKMVNNVLNGNMAVENEWLEHTFGKNDKHSFRVSIKNVENNAGKEPGMILLALHEIDNGNNV